MLALIHESAAAQDGTDFVADFLSMDGAHRAFGLLGVMEAHPDFERPRLGAGGEFKQMLPDGSISLRALLIRSPSTDGDSELAVDLGVEVFPVRAGRFAIGLEAFGGVADMAPPEDADLRLRYGAGGGFYLGLSEHFGVGFSGTRVWVDQEAARWGYWLRMMFF